MHTGQRVARTRQMLRMTQQELGDFVYKSASQIGRYESGERIPKCTLKRIAVALCVTPEYLSGKRPGADIRLQADRAYRKASFLDVMFGRI